jgi:hypothetical protein
MIRLWVFADARCLLDALDDVLPRAQEIQTRLRDSN